MSFREHVGGVDEWGAGAAIVAAVLAWLVPKLVASFLKARDFDEEMKYDANFQPKKSQ